MKQKMFRRDSTLTGRSPISSIKRLLFTVTVEGVSALPELAPGSRWLASNALKPRIGDFIVFRNPSDERRVFVKKITAQSGGVYFAAGTAPQADSSATFGLVPRSAVLGTMILRL